MQDLISEQYRALIGQMHKIHKWGGDGHKHAASVYDMCVSTKSLSVLDYGCGRGTLKKKLKDIADVLMVNEYDPAIKGKDAPPKPADFVVCTDVLEHIEPDKIDNVLQHINALSKKSCYLVISCRAANAVLPNGKNAHLIIKPAEWWLEKIKSIFKGCVILEKEGGKAELCLWIIKE
jgi:2-polyprenyl-3-methyl-5-hydroxy-6-metoxy-1,4-benzoquinol methylase